MVKNLRVAPGVPTFVDCKITYGPLLFWKKDVSHLKTPP